MVDRKVKNMYRRWKFVIEIISIFVGIFKMYGLILVILFYLF